VNLFGYGSTLADAALMKGYMSAAAGSFVCDNCRMADGHDLVEQVISESQSWPSDPLIRAFKAILRGMIYEDHGLTYWQMVDRWLKLPIPPKDIALAYQKRPARMPIWTPFGRTPYRPAKVGYWREQGWEFPGTVYDEHERGGRLMGTYYWAWGGATRITRNGNVWIDNNRYDRGKSANAAGNLHLLVEMARQAVKHTAGPWEGPDVGWNPPEFKVGDPLPPHTIGR
jgi:hypothetical protein